MEEVDPPKIVSVKLVNASMFSERVLNRLDLTKYPVMVGLSRSVTLYEQLELENLHSPFTFQDDDPMSEWTVIWKTTLEDVRSDIDRLHGMLATAARGGAALAAKAAEEDARLHQLANEINVELRAA